MNGLKGGTALYSSRGWLTKMALGLTAALYVDLLEWRRNGILTTDLHYQVGSFSVRIRVYAPCDQPLLELQGDKKRKETKFSSFTPYFQEVLFICAVR